MVGLSLQIQYLKIKQQAKTSIPSTLNSTEKVLEQLSLTLFGTKDGFHGRRFFPQTPVRGDSF